MQYPKIDPSVGHEKKEKNPRRFFVDLMAQKPLRRLLDLHGFCNNT